ncbi:MAG: thioesterase family protein [Desulfofustis sp.]|jgi:acyl-CoA thioester hydrolase
MTDSTSQVYNSQYRVLYGDTDAGGIVYNANYLRFFELGRSDFMRTYVCSYREIEERGLILPVTECFARYKAPAFYDDLVTIETRASELTRYTCTFNYRITRQDQDRPRPTLLVKGHTIHAAITKAGKLTPLPDYLRTRMQLLATTPKNHAPAKSV